MVHTFLQACAFCSYSEMLLTDNSCDDVDADEVPAGVL